MTRLLGIDPTQRKVRNGQGKNIRNVREKDTEILKTLLLEDKKIVKER